MAQNLLIIHNLVLMTILFVFGVKSSTSDASRPTDSDVGQDLLPNENHHVETLTKLSSVENENKLIDEIASCGTKICEHVDNALENSETESNSLDNPAVFQSKVADNVPEPNSKAIVSEAELKVANQLESLRHIASNGVVKVLKKLDDILERRENLVLPSQNSEEEEEEDDDDEEEESSSSLSASSKRLPSANSLPFSSTSSSSSSFQDAEERLKLASAKKLKTELESLVDDALDLVGDRLRRHLKSTTNSGTASGAESTEEEMKQLLKKLEEKSERRKERKKADGN